MTEFISEEFIDEILSEEKIPDNNNNQICVFSPDYDGCLSSIICEEPSALLRLVFQ